MRKKLLLVFLIFLIFFTILVFILTKIEYKNTNSGNNISKSNSTDILDISSYEANITLEIHSNKNTNKYIMHQEYAEPNIFKQEIIEPNSIKGLTITYDGEKTIVENKRIELNALYENFNGNISNLSLASFIDEYKNGSESETIQNEDEIVMKTKISSSKNKYQMYQNLYIDKDSNLPTKMEILDINKNITVYILYNEITVNKINKEEILKS